MTDKKPDPKDEQREREATKQAQHQTAGTNPQDQEQIRRNEAMQRGIPKTGEGSPDTSGPPSINEPEGSNVEPPEVQAQEAAQTGPSTGPAGQQRAQGGQPGQQPQPGQPPAPQPPDDDEEEVEEDEEEEDETGKKTGRKTGRKVKVKKKRK